MRNRISTPAVVSLVLLTAIAMIATPVQAYPHLAIGASPTDLRFYQGYQARSTININSVENFGPANLTLSTYVEPDTPAGPSAFVTPVNVTLPAGGTVTSVLTVASTPSTQPGKYVITVVAIWNPPCFYLQPPCLMPSLYSSVDVTVTVVLLGDVNGDCTVNILDVSSVALAYGTTPKSASWNPNADLYRDDAVNIIDAAVASFRYGNSCS